MGQIKIFGDIAAHDFKVDSKEQDVIPDFRLLRLALAGFDYVCDVEDVKLFRKR